MLLGAVNALQLIVHMPLANIVFPANAHFFFSILRDIVTFDILPTDFIKYDMFLFSEVQV